MRLKTLLRGQPRSYNQVKHCQIEGCEASTREGKPYCPEHVGRNDYVQQLMAKIAEKDNEAERVMTRGQKVISNDSITLQDIVQDLKLHGSRTVARLSREFQLDSKIISGYVQRLVKEGRAETFRTNRGNESVRLVSSRRLFKATCSGRFQKIAELTHSGRYQTV